MLPWDMAWVKYLALQTTSLLAQVMFLKLHLLFSSSWAQYGALEPVCEAAFSCPRLLLR